MATSSGIKLNLCRNSLIERGVLPATADDVDWDEEDEEEEEFEKEYEVDNEEIRTWQEIWYVRFQGNVNEPQALDLRIVWHFELT